MSKRNFGTIKSLLHFDYPYYNEPGDGLGDEVGLETWSKESNAAALYGSQIPKAGDCSPKFGYRCLYAYGAVIGTNNTGIWNLNSSGEYEVEFFVFNRSNSNAGVRYLFRLYSETDVILTVALNASGYIEVRCPEWGITSAVTTSETIVPAVTGGWRHVLLRVSENTLKIYIEGTEALSQALTPDVTLSVNDARIGYNSKSSYGKFYIDEFVFRHSAGSGAPVVPTEPYSGVLDISKVGGYAGVGERIIEATTIDSDTALNQTGCIGVVTDSRTFSVCEWVSGYDSITAGSEVMVHISAPVNNVASGYSQYRKMPEVMDYPLVGMYAFAKVESIDGTNVVLERDITTGNGYDFTLNAELLDTYVVQVISVPCYETFTLNGTITPAQYLTPNKLTYHLYGDTNYIVYDGNSYPFTRLEQRRGGIVALRTTGDCTINGSILTSGKGPDRYDLHQMTHSKLVDRFLCSKGGGIFIACGGTFRAGSTARLGASWSGFGENGNGAAGYGGNGGNVNPSATVSGSGGAGGVGGGGGGASCASTSSSAIAAGGAAGSTGGSATTGGGGGGCGGNGGNGSSYAGGSGGGGQAGSGGTSGTGKTPSGSAGKVDVGIRVC